MGARMRVDSFLSKIFLPGLVAHFQELHEKHIEAQKRLIRHDEGFASASSGKSFASTASAKNRPLSADNRGENHGSVSKSNVLRATAMNKVLSEMSVVHALSSNLSAPKVNASRSVSSTGSRKASTRRSSASRGSSARPTSG